MTLSAVQLAAAEVPGGTYTVVYEVPADHRTILRDVRVYAHDSSVARDVICLVAPSANGGVAFVFEHPPGGPFITGLVDTFMVLDAGDQVYAYTDDGVLSVLLSGHEFAL